MKITTLQLVLLLIGGANVSALAAPESTPIPVIYDTDLGEDIDDAWALCYLLNSPELDLKLVTIGFGNVRPKIKIAAKLLTAVGRTDIPIGIGKSTGDWPPNYAAWAEDFDLDSYPGEIVEDGIGKLVQTIKEDQTGLMKLITVGSFHNTAAALDREPGIADNVWLVSMAGCIYRSPKSQSKVTAETNVRVGIPASRKVFAADWKQFTIAPLDVTTRLRLTGSRYQKVYRSEAPAARAIISAYKIFEPNAEWADFDTSAESSTLHDLVAVHLSYEDEFLELYELPLRISNAGRTLLDGEEGHFVEVALAWKDRESFLDLIVKRITR